MSATMLSLSLAAPSPPAFLPPSLARPVQSMPYFLCCLWNGTHSLLFAVFHSAWMNLRVSQHLTLIWEWWGFVPFSPLLSLPPLSNSSSPFHCQWLTAPPISVSLRREEPAYGVHGGEEGGGGCHMYVCVVQPCLALPPPTCVAPVCVLFVLSTLLRGVLPPLSATVAAAAVAAAAAATTAVAGTVGEGWGVGGTACVANLPWAWTRCSCETRTHAGAQTEKTLCIWGLELRFGKVTWPDGAGQRVGGSETGMWVGEFCHAQFEPGLVDWQRR